MTTRELPDPASFIAAATDLGLRDIVLAWQDEWSQVPDQSAVEYRHVRLVWLLGYADGAILRCGLRDDAADRVALVDRLRQAGFTVSQRCRNLGTGLPR